MTVRRTPQAEAILELRRLLTAERVLLTIRRDGVGTAVERWMVVGWAEAPEAATRLVRWAAGRA